MAKVYGNGGTFHRIRMTLKNPDPFERLETPHQRRERIKKLIERKEKKHA